MMKITENLADGDCEAPERDYRSAAPLPQSGGDHLSHYHLVDRSLQMGNSDQGLCASCWDYALRRLRQTFFARHSFHASKSVLINRIGVDKVLKDQGPLSFSGAEEIWIKKRGRAGANLSGWPSMVGGRALFALIDTSWLEVALIQPQQCIAWPQTTFPTTNKPLQV